jgi:putative membrane protein
MMVSASGSVRTLLQWQQPRAREYVAAATIAWVIHAGFSSHFIDLPLGPVSVVGAAIGIFTSFRTNAAYDRWWEGRKLWGRMINSSRHFANQVAAYVAPVDKPLADALVRRHVSYVHTLRTLLRAQAPLDDHEVTQFLSTDEIVQLGNATNMTHALLRIQTKALTELADEGKLDGLRLQSLDSTLMDFLNIQGGCERIKGTPLPGGYVFIADTLVRYFAFVFPFAIVHEAGFYAIPLNLLVCMAFNLINEAGRVLEDPFTLFFNGLPLAALSRKIERDLRHGLGDTDLPPNLVPDHRGILM